MGTAGSAEEFQESGAMIIFEHQEIWLITAGKTVGLDDHSKLGVTAVIPVSDVDT